MAEALTIEQYINRINQFGGLVSGDIAADVLIKPAAEMLQAIKIRITQQGLNSKGSSIGRYSVTPIYATRKQFVKPGAFHPQGKKSKFGNTIGDRLVPTVRLKSTGIKKNAVKYKNYTLVKTNLKPRTTMYLGSGYKELREIQSLKTAVVNIQYSGETINSYISEREGNQVIMGLNNANAVLKKEGNEKHFGSPILAPTPLEIQNYESRVNFSLNRLTRGFIEGQDIQSLVQIISNE